MNRNRYRSRQTGELVSAQQFDSLKPKHYPPGFNSWPDAEGYKPRDASWGYVSTKMGRLHVREHDWVVEYLDSNATRVLSADVFAMEFEKLG